MTAIAPTPLEGASGMRAHARLRTELEGPDAYARGLRRTRVDVLRSQAPLKLRPVIARGAEPWTTYAGMARVCLTAAAAGPMGGDELVLDVEVGAGSTLVLTEASATLLLQGRGGGPSTMRVRVRVETDATFVWLPEPVIAARGCHHENHVTVELAGSARLLMREELLLGRRGEASGRLRQVVRVRRDGCPLHVQDLRLGEDWSHTPAVVGGHRAVGSLLVVAPDLALSEPVPLAGDGAVMPLAAGQAVLAQVLSGDSIGLRRALDETLILLGPPWDPRTGSAPVTASTKESG